MRNSFLAFIEVFDPYLRASHRWDALRFIAAELLATEKPIHIGETGSIRVDGNWGGDGQSTKLWAWLARETRGSVFSVDSDPATSALTKQLCPSVDAICSDSLSFLAQNRNRLFNLNLLYLDSADYSFPYVHSELHHVGEHALAYPSLPSGCLIAVDDCHGPMTGKHALIKAFFKRAGIAPIHESYITVWRKP